jgi:hypothetical protein
VVKGMIFIIPDIKAIPVPAAAAYSDLKDATYQFEQTYVPNLQPRAVNNSL